MSLPATFPIRALIIFMVGWLAATSEAASALPSAERRTSFSESIRALPETPTNAAGGTNRAFISRMTLRPEETAAVMPFEVALSMRNFDELEARLAHSEIIAPEEMQARYLPLAIDHDRVLRWLTSEGLEITRTDSNRLAIFARGSVAEVARVFQTNFARVTANGAEFTSAITAPSVPESLAPAVRGIHGLQPNQRLRVRPHLEFTPLAGTGSSIPYYPAQIKQAYGASSLTQTGAGQTIAIYSLAFPSSTDLTSFWATTGVAASLANIQKINVAGGPPSSTSSNSLEEATLDVEWASALAPGAVIRIYAASENDPVGDDELIQQILADLPTQPTLHQLTISYGLDENGADRDYIAIEAQYMANLVSAGVTVFAASGDNGALDNEDASVQTGFPPSMPDVTAVGGTTLILDSNSNVASETAWGSLANRGTSGASGGGISTIFKRPSWQNVVGAPVGTMRLVPDVASFGDPSTGALVVFNGRSVTIGGTSLSSPTWAAWCALINQSRAASGKAPLGALNPRIYPLAGTAAFRDITSGGNSVYQAGGGYDLCTGIGVPNVANLLQATTADTFAPVVEVESGNRFTTTGQGATFYIIATSNPSPTYTWQRLAAGTSSWATLTNGSSFQGANTYALLILGATADMNGDQYRCVVSNSFGNVTGTAETLTVASTGVSTFAGWPGWSGFADGQSSIGRFNFTGSVRLDSAGNVYVADASNDTVRKITPGGLVSTLAGSPNVTGSTDGAGSAARFNGPAGVAVDAAGNVFVADSQNYTIRKITPAGVVSTLAGSAGVEGRTDGTGAGASFYDPEDLTIDASGNLYVADGAGNIVRKVTPAGVVTTLAGAAASGTTDGTGATARFNLLAGITVDTSGNVYVGDYNNNAIRKITPAGVVTTLAGLAGTKNSGSADGTGTIARFYGPAGLAVDASGNVYVADSGNNAVRKVTAAGVVTTLAGLSTNPENIDGPLASARFDGLADVAFDGSGNLYVADAYNCTIRRIALSSSTVTSGPVPVIAAAPQGQTVLLGSTLALGVTVTGTGPFTYQWSRNGAVIAGATDATYAISGVTAGTAGSYTVAITNGGGTVNSSAAVVTTTTGSASRLTNLSVRSNAGTDAQTLIAGFVLSGSATKTLLLRGIGPSLSLFGLTGLLADPSLTVLGPNSSTLVAASNDNWKASDAATMTAVGAFPLTAGSLDAAVVATLASGNYTAEITGAGGTTGLALAEIYDTAPAATTDSRLVNLSARAQVSTGGGVLIAGFTITGNVSKTVLIRGVGPGIAAAPFNVSGTLADPRLDLYSNTTLVQSNDDWGGTSALTAAFAQAGAFSLPSAASKDTALLITLPPGNYTAQISGVASTSGVALVEIYEIN